MSEGGVEKCVEGCDEGRAGGCAEGSYLKGNDLAMK